MINDEAIINDEQYKQLDKAIFDTLHIISKHLGDKNSYLIDQLESLYNLQENIAEQLSYEQGVKDALDM